jgi:hypothetical protein
VNGEFEEIKKQIKFKYPAAMARLSFYVRMKVKAGFRREKYS